MATYVVVDKDKDPLDPGEINAGSTIQVNDGDVFVIDASADDDIKFESATGLSIDFEIQIDDSNSNDFKVEIKDNLNADITIADDADLSDVDIIATNADSVTLTAGNNVSLGKYQGSDDGADTLTIGDDFTTSEDIQTKGGDDSITIGDGASIQDIDTGDGDNTITIGEDLIATDIKSGDGEDTVTIGDNADLHNIDTGKGDDSITIGDDLSATDIKTGDGQDDLTIGDGAVVDDIDTGKGDDTVVLGDDFTGDKVETKDGNDRVTIGSGGSIDDLDGGNGTDTLQSETDIPGASNFENVVCFADGTLIRTETGDVPVEMLVTGDRVQTLDHGLQRVRWIGSSFVIGRGAAAPVCIAKGALGNTHELRVSQQHRILLGGWKAQLYFGEPQVLVPAKHLVDGHRIKIVEVTCVGYFHLLFEQHEIVFSEGIASESFYPGQVGMASMSDSSCAEIYRLFPRLREDPEALGQLARPTLRAHEAQLLADKPPEPCVSRGARVQQFRAA